MHERRSITQCRTCGKGFISPPGDERTQCHNCAQAAAEARARHERQQPDHDADDTMSYLSHSSLRSAISFLAALGNRIPRCARRGRLRAAAKQSKPPVKGKQARPQFRALDGQFPCQLLRPEAEKPNHPAASGGGRGSAQAVCHPPARVARCVWGAATPRPTPPGYSRMFTGETVARFPQRPHPPAPRLSALLLKAEAFASERDSKSI